MNSFTKRAIKNGLNFFGLDIIRLNNNPRSTLLGLKNLPFRTIIDAGANEGQFAREITKVFPDARIYCFEPLLEPYKKLKDWAEIQGVSTFNVALGEREEIIEMFNHREHNPSSSLLKTTKICEEIYPFTKQQVAKQVKVITLDNWLDNLTASLEPEILIKMDVQGYEDRVVKGGIEIFKKAKACILEVCLDRLYEGQADFEELCVMLYDLGFHYAGNLEQAYDKDGHVIYIDGVFVKAK